MIIVITHDQTMRDYYGNYVSHQEPNYQFWQRVTVLPSGLNQQNATARLATLLSQLGPSEPLCLVGHGNDDGIGDEHSGPGTWWWDSRSLSDVLLNQLPNNYDGPVLIEACGDTEANLPPRLANALEGSRLAGLWIYGHQYEVELEDPLPSERHLGGAFYPGAQVS